MKDVTTKVSWILNFLFSGIGVYFIDKLFISKISFDEINLLAFLNKSLRISVLDLIIFLIFITVGIFIINKLKSNNDSIYDYTKKQKKLKKFNSDIDTEKGIQYKWDVHFDFTGKLYINNLTPFCTNHGTTPLRMVSDYNYYGGRFRCSICDSKVSSQDLSFLKNLIESDLIKRYDEMK